ncbi:MAG: methyltransferase domain-containing protein [Cellulosilyticum sp.]|nr:methyltransferase domain-containing protein [Cellulosilyticum sp.]
MKWNATLYEQYGQERLQPALDLIHRIPKREYSRIIDIGCGSGMSTLPLAERFTEAEVLGVDYSKEMLEKAREGSEKIIWKQRDCSKSLTDLGQFDLVFSNAFLQWLQNQEAFIAHTIKLLKEDGIFALQVPNYDDMPIKKCVDQVTALFGNRFETVEKGMCHNKSLSEYYDILCSYFEEVTIWQTNYAHVMNGYEDIVNFMSATGIRAYLQVLDQEEQEWFIGQLIMELKKVYPVQKNGKILFTFERIEWIAKKKKYSKK